MDLVEILSEAVDKKLYTLFVFFFIYVKKIKTHNVEGYLSTFQLQLVGWSGLIWLWQLY